MSNTIYANLIHSVDTDKLVLFAADSYGSHHIEFETVLDFIKDLGITHLDNVSQHIRKHLCNLDIEGVSFCLEDTMILEPCDSVLALIRFNLESPRTHAENINIVVAETLKDAHSFVKSETYSALEKIFTDSLNNELAQILTSLKIEDTSADSKCPKHLYIGVVNLELTGLLNTTLNEYVNSIYSEFMSAYGVMPVQNIFEVEIFIPDMS